MDLPPHLSPKDFHGACHHGRPRDQMSGLLPSSLSPSSISYSSQMWAHHLFCFGLCVGRHMVVLYVITKVLSWHPASRASWTSFLATDTANGTMGFQIGLPLGTRICPTPKCLSSVALHLQGLPQTEGTGPLLWSPVPPLTDPIHGEMVGKGAPCPLSLGLRPLCPRLIINRLAAPAQPASCLLRSTLPTFWD